MFACCGLVVEIQIHLTAKTYMLVAPPSNVNPEVVLQFAWLVVFLSILDAAELRMLPSKLGLQPAIVGSQADCESWR